MITQIKNLTIREVANLVKWKDVKAALQYHYELKNINNYQHCLKRIQTAPKKRIPNEEVAISASNNDWGKGIGLDLSYHICIKKKNDDTNWAMSFVSWDNLINLKVSDRTFEHYTLNDIIAHFIYEMTWYGNEKQTKKEGKKLLGRVKEIKKNELLPKK